MIRAMLIGFGILCVVGIGAVAIAASRFNGRLDRLEALLKREAPVTVRTDLPPEVMALAARYGVSPGHGSRFAQFDETGQMWSAPGASQMNFSARQTISTSDPYFLWRAKAGPAGLVKVADYLMPGGGGLEARILGVVPVASDVGRPQTIQGEAMRYLAELPWNPDALLYNHALEWKVIDGHHLRVATGHDDVRAEVVLELDETGLIIGSGAESRPRLENGHYIPTPWHGRFRDYARVDGRMVPMAGEVAWTINGTPFVYWRGRVANWSAK
jgi:hypothetical protein